MVAELEIGPTVPQKHSARAKLDDELLASQVAPLPHGPFVKQEYLKPFQLPTSCEGSECPHFRLGASGKSVLCQPAQGSSHKE